MKRLTLIILLLVSPLAAQTTDTWMPVIDNIYGVPNADLYLSVLNHCLAQNQASIFTSVACQDTATYAMQKDMQARLTDVLKDLRAADSDLYKQLMKAKQLRLIDDNF